MLLFIHTYTLDTMFCKICFDMKKNPSCYTGHNIKQGNMVICPELKKIKCLKCKEFGHMTSYCHKVKPDSRVKPDILTKPHNKPLVKSQVKKVINRYNILSLEETEDETDEETDDEPYLKPELMRSTNSIKWKMGFSWAEEME